MKAMKRLVALALTIVMSLAAFTAFGVLTFADDAADVNLLGAAKYGTPKVDGKRDDMYDNTVNVSIGMRDPERYCPMDNSERDNWASKNPLKPGDVTGAVLWDSEYLYLYGRAYDKDICDDDNISFFLLYEDYCYAVGCSAGGEVSTDDGSDYDKYMSEGIVNVKKEEGYWECEMRIALYSLTADEEYLRGFHLYYGNHDSDTLDADLMEIYTSGVFFDDKIYFSAEKADPNATGDDNNGNKTPSPIKDDMLKYGKPKVDGKLDAIYENSYSFGIDSAEGGCTLEEATVYMLWDEEYIYFAAKVYDPNPSKSSFCTFFLNDSDPKGTGNFIMETITVDATGAIVSQNGRDDGEITFDPNMTMAASETYDGYYVLEVAVNFKELHAGRTFRFHLIAGTDLDNEPESYVICGNGGNFLNNSFRTIREEAVAVDRNETSADDGNTTEPKENNDTTTADNGSNNDSKSGCGSVIAANGLIALIALAGIPFVTRKKKQ